MIIQITKGQGSGKTLLSAFDTALKNTGVLNYNLIPLSSVIPPQTTVEEIDSYRSPADHWGHRLYVVMAQQRSDKAGHVIASGIGWYFFEGEKGVFVEHEVECEPDQDEESVRQMLATEISSSLSDLCLNRAVEFNPSKVHMTIESAVIENQPKCVLVLAVYKAEGWGE